MDDTIINGLSTWIEWRDPGGYRATSGITKQTWAKQPPLHKHTRAKLKLIIHTDERKKQMHRWRERERDRWEEKLNIPQEWSNKDPVYLQWDTDSQEINIIRLLQ